jgi:hypothetical protein
MTVFLRSLFYAIRYGPDEKVIAVMSDREKTAMLVRLFDGDAHAAIELRTAVFDRLRPERGTPPLTARTVGELRARASAIRLAGAREEAEKAAAERQRQAKQAEEARQAWLDVIARRGDSVGARSRLRSSAAMWPATIRQWPSSRTCERSPRNAAR